jgi:trehalose 6-phosphate phosphatase
MPTLPDLPPPSRAAFLLDFDGTLVDIAPAPDAVVVEPGLIADLHRLRARIGEALAIVSGRPIAQIDALLQGAPYALAGEHGTEFRHAPGAAAEPLDIPQLPAAWIDHARALAAAHPGAKLELKRFGFTLHYRAAPAAGAELGRALQSLLAHDPGRNTVLVPAKMGWEVRPVGADKGTAVNTIMARTPFQGRLPVFVGDDVTDEDGMRAARALGGIGLRVDEVFGTPAGVRAWIAGLARGEGWPA